MTTALFVLAVVAALACPAHMLWRMRRRPAAGAEASPGELAGLRRRRAKLEARIDAIEQP